jgi:hypothetical protein
MLSGIPGANRGVNRQTGEAVQSTFSDSRSSCPLIEEIMACLISSPQMAVSLFLKMTSGWRALNSQEIASWRASSILDGMPGKWHCWTVNGVGGFFFLALGSYICSSAPSTDNTQCTVAPCPACSQAASGDPSTQGLSLDSLSIFCHLNLLRSLATMLCTLHPVCYIGWVAWGEAPSQSAEIHRDILVPLTLGVAIPWRRFIWGNTCVYVCVCYSGSGCVQVSVNLSNHVRSLMKENLVWVNV